jgi:general secretion pathway protein I
MPGRAHRRVRHAPNRAAWWGYTLQSPSPPAYPVPCAVPRGVPKSVNVTREEHGFTLLEALVAFVIAALALGVLFDAGVSALRGARAASRYEQAVARARSHLALAVHTSPLVPGDWQGDDGSGFTWHLRVTPLASTAVRPVNAVSMRGMSNFPVTLCALSVSIAWREGGTSREVRWDTAQIAQGIR